jgi:hypothetical protein
MKHPPVVSGDTTYVPWKRITVVCRPCQDQITILSETRRLSYGVCGCRETLWIVDNKTGLVSKVRAEIHRPRILGPASFE